MLGFSPGTEAGNPSQATSVSSQAGEQVPPEEGKQQKKPGKKKKKGDVYKRQGPLCDEDPLWTQRRRMPGEKDRT